MQQATAGQQDGWTADWTAALPRAMDEGVLQHYDYPYKAAHLT